MNNTKIVLINPYFGKWPCWFDFFIESCRHNPKIDWLFFTDCGEPKHRAPNVRFVHCTFAEYNKRVSDALGINFEPVNAYKLCDIRPAYGLIHKDEIAGYDFWGWGDVDVIYGDLQGYITAEMLQHNLVSFHGHRVSGHLCLIKNTEEMRNVFIDKCREWREIFEDKNHRACDERQFNEIFIRHRNWPAKLRRIVYYPRYFMRTAFFKEAYSTSFGFIPWIDGSSNFPDEWRWEKGLLTTPVSGSRSFPYVHFLHWKKHWPPEKLLDASVQDAVWYIRKDGIFK